jgi:1A family penicillin-binding protein
MKKKHLHHIRNVIIGGLSLCFLFGGMLIVLVSLAEVPDFNSFNDRIVANSTKIYDRTGEVLLYDVHQDIKRTEIDPTTINLNIKNATVAIEDSTFYQHKGVKPIAIVRAFLVNVTSGTFSQGGSTITQQIIKNTLLTQEKTLTRKIKEWILALKLEGVASKDEILGIYLNEVPYGGNIYGIEEASKTYFDKSASELTLAESAYLAALPRAPSFYSPYGSHKAELDSRKNLVLSRMKELNFISNEEYETAKSEVVVFMPVEKTGIRAPHFVFFVREYLEEKYGPDAIATGGLKVTTTLDWVLEEKAEEIVAKQVPLNQANFNGSNAAVVALNPKTGEILSMVGSRNYFDKEIDGQFNVTTAKRQPGSSFKPFVYATALMRGYTPETVLFDVPTEFQTTCDSYGNALPGKSQLDCYMPDNYDGSFRGPMTIYDALAQSINVPAVKAMYLVGATDAIKTSRDMGITTLTDPTRYGLTLVIGGGEVTLLDMVSAYGTFATGGTHHQYVSILKIEDSKGKVLEEFIPTPGTEVLPKNTTLQISEILSDNTARIPTFGANSSLVVPGREVAAKTGTTNNNKDAWTVGYTPSLVVGVWAGNNDNTPMKKGGVALAGPIWNQVISAGLSGTSTETFEKPVNNSSDTLKPILRGIWQGGETFVIDSISGKLATEYTPPQTQVEKVLTNVHDILYWVDRNDPLGPIPSNPESDPQFTHWETAAQNWWKSHSHVYPMETTSNKPNDYDDVHVPKYFPEFKILGLPTSKVNPSVPITLSVSYDGHFPLARVDAFLNGNLIGSSTQNPYSISFIPNANFLTKTSNELRVVVYDSVYNSKDETVELEVAL